MQLEEGRQIFYRLNLETFQTTSYHFWSEEKKKKNLSFSNNLFFPSILLSLQSLPQTNSGRFVTLIQGRNLPNGFVNIAGCLFTLRFIAIFQGDKERKENKKKKEEEEERRWEQRGRERGTSKKKKGGRVGNHSIVSAEGKRYEYSNFTPLIRDGCLFLWGTALLVFVSSLIICMMYSAALYSVMGEKMTFWQDDNEA